MSGLRFRNASARFAAVPSPAVPAVVRPATRLTASPATRLAAFLLTFLVTTLLVFAPTARAADLDLRADASFTAAPDGGQAAGDLDLRNVVRRKGERARIRVRLHSLDVTRDKNGNPPDYYAVLTAPDDGPTTYLGELRVSRRGIGRLRVRHAERLLPDAFASLRDFEGGAVEVRRGEEVIATVGVPRLTSSRAGVGATGERVFGRFESIDSVTASGTWQLRVERHATGEVRNRVAVVASRLPQSSYRVYLIGPSNVTVDLGALALSTTGSGRLYLDSRRAAIPGVSDLSTFGRGRIEVRRGSVVSLSSFIPSFRSVDKPPLAQRHTYARGTVQLSPDEADPAAQGILSARADVLPARQRRSIRACFVGLDPGRSPFTVAVTWTTGTRTVLGTFDARTPSGIAFVTLQHGISYGELLAMSDGAVEVLDRTGARALTGTFPDLDG